jgi:hypothetical protein
MKVTKGQQGWCGSGVSLVAGVNEWAAVIIQTLGKLWNSSKESLMQKETHKSFS